jgi:hypothetical protein
VNADDTVLAGGYIEGGSQLPPAARLPRRVRIWKLAGLARSPMALYTMHGASHVELEKH